MMQSRDGELGLQLKGFFFQFGKMEGILVEDIVMFEKGGEKFEKIYNL